jgi:hypothetical protein
MQKLSGTHPFDFSTDLKGTFPIDHRQGYVRVGIVVRDLLAGFKTDLVNLKIFLVDQIPRMVWQSLQLYLCQTLFPKTTSSVSLSVFVRLGIVVWVSLVSQRKTTAQMAVPHIKKFRAAFFSIGTLLDNRPRSFERSIGTYHAMNRNGKP